MLKRVNLAALDRRFSRVSRSVGDVAALVTLVAGAATVLKVVLG